MIDLVSWDVGLSCTRDPSQLYNCLVSVINAVQSESFDIMLPYDKLQCLSFVFFIFGLSSLHVWLSMYGRWLWRVPGVCLACAWRVPRAILCLACCSCLCSQFLGVFYFCPVLHCCEIELVVFSQYILSRVIPFHACASSAVRSSIVLYNTTRVCAVS